jgi:hypothetical protein
MVVGGIGIFHQLAVRTGLVDAVDERVEVSKRHLPYWESDHVLNIAFNTLAGGTCMEDIELRRNDEVFLDALGAQRIPGTDDRRGLLPSPGGVVGAPELQVEAREAVLEVRGALEVAEPPRLGDPRGEHALRLGMRPLSA